MTTKETPIDDTALTTDIIQDYIGDGPQAYIYLGLSSSKKGEWIKNQHPEIGRPLVSPSEDHPHLYSIQVENCLYIANKFFSILVNVLVDDGLCDVDPKQNFTHVKKHCQAAINQVCAEKHLLPCPLSITYDWVRPWLESNIYADETQADFLQQFKDDFFESDFQNALCLFNQGRQQASNCIFNALVNDEFKVYDYNRKFIIADIPGDDYDQLEAMIKAVRDAYHIKVYLLDMIYDDAETETVETIQKIRRNWKRMRKAHSLIGVDEVKWLEWLDEEKGHYRVRR